MADFSVVPRATAPRYHVKTGISISSVHVRLLVQKLPKRNFTNSRVGTATDYVDMRASFFTGRMPFLTPNQQRQSTEGHTEYSKFKLKLIVILDGLQRI